MKVTCMKVTRTQNRKVTWLVTKMRDQLAGVLPQSSGGAKGWSKWQCLHKGWTQHPWVDMAVSQWL